MALRNRPKIAPIPAFHPLLLMIRLDGCIAVKPGLPGSAYPKRSKTALALPHLPLLGRNINLLPFRGSGITSPLRIA